MKQAAEPYMAVCLVCVCVQDLYCLLHLCLTQAALLLQPSLFGGGSSTV